MCVACGWYLLTAPAAGQGRPREAHLDAMSSAGSAVLAKGHSVAGTGRVGCRPYASGSPVRINRGLHTTPSDRSLRVPRHHPSTRTLRRAPPPLPRPIPTSGHRVEALCRAAGRAPPLPRPIPTSGHPIQSRPGRCAPPHGGLARPMQRGADGARIRPRYCTLSLARTAPDRPQAAAEDFKRFAILWNFPL